MSKKQKKMLIRIIVALVVFIACEITEKLIHLNGVWDTVVKAAMFAVPYLMAGYDVLLKAIKNISKGHVFDENFLMAVATVGAYGFAEIDYVGDVAQIYADGELVADDYYYGKTWRVPCKLLYGKECYMVISEMKDDFYKEF